MRMPVPRRCWAEPSQPQCRSKPTTYARSARRCEDQPPLKLHLSKISDQELPSSRNMVATPCASWPYPLPVARGAFASKATSTLKTAGKLSSQMSDSLMTIPETFPPIYSEDDSNSAPGRWSARLGCIKPCFRIHVCRLPGALHTSYAIVVSTTCPATMSSTSPRRSWPPGRRRTTTTPTRGLGCRSSRSSGSQLLRLW